MSNFLRSLFGAKKATKVNKSRMQNRRLELLGLEERVVPAISASFSGSTLLIAATGAETFTVSSSNTGQVTVSSATTVTSSGGVSIATGNVITVDSGASNVQVISITGDGAANQVVTLNDILSGGFNSNFGLSLSLGTAGADALTLSGTITLKGSGTLDTSTSDIETITLGSSSALALTSVSGLVKIDAGTATALNLGGNVTINSTSGNVTLADNVTSGAGNSLTINAGSGTVSTQGLGTSTGLGAVSLSSTATSNPSVLVTGLILSTGGLTLNGAGDVSVTGGVNATAVNAKSSAGDVIFGGVVTTTTGATGFVSEATLASKYTKIAAGVTVGAGANALITGNLMTTGDNTSVTIGGPTSYIQPNTGPGITVNGAGNISITGKVDASASTNDLYLKALNGAITITGAVGSGTAPNQLFVDGAGSFTASSTITVGSLGVGLLNSFATSVSFADAVKVTGADYNFTADGTTPNFAFALDVNTTGSGTIGFSKTIEASNSNGRIGLASQNGNISVTGTITGKDDVVVSSSGSGLVTLSDNITTDQTDGDVIITSTTGGITTKGVSTSGATADIEIDTDTSGNITIGGNVSASGGGDILLGADTGTFTATGTGNLTINGTVSTTSGDIYIGSGGTGTVSVNKGITTTSAAGDVKIIAVGTQTNAINFAKDATITSAGGVAFTTSGNSNTISFVSGANITSAGNVTDTGTGNINLANNITTTAGDIVIDTNSITLTGDSALKAGGTTKAITLGTVDGAKILSMEATGAITTGDIGQKSSLSGVTVVNSTGVTFANLTAANVVITDGSGSVNFNGNTSITTGLTTQAKAYSVSFAASKTALLSGAPEFKNTGSVTFAGTTSFTTGATITGNSSSTATLGGTIVSGGALNVAAINNLTISNGTQLILNSTSKASTFASKVTTSTSSDTLQLLGVGTLTLSGDSSSSYSGKISVINGTLNVTGKLNSASVSTLTNGSLTGAGGTIGALTSNVGTIAPGGKLITGGAIGMSAATNYNVAITSSTAASNLETSQAISLGSAVLNLTSVASGLKTGDQLTIINNTGASAITGTFVNAAEGATVSAKDASGNTVNFKISYLGADGKTGNDAVLTVTSVTPSTPTPTAPAQPMVAGQPALNKFTAVGADAGGGPLVTLTFSNGTYVSFFAYASSFRGGVRVALGDVNGDGSTDVITGAGPGGGPQVNVYNVNAQTGAVSLQSSFFAFSAPSFTGGVYVAAGHANGDAFDDVIVGAGAGGGSRVQVYAGSASGVVSSSTLNDFFAYSPAFTGGVVVAAGDRNADGDDEVITAPASNGGYNVKSFDTNGTGNNPTLVDNFFAFNNTTAVGGLSLAVGYLNTGGVADLVIGTTNGGYGVIVDSATSGIAGVPFAGFTGAIRAGVAEDSTGKDYAVALAGPTGGPRVSVFSVGATSLTETDNLFVMNPAFTGGLFGTPTLEENIPA